MSAAAPAADLDVAKFVLDVVGSRRLDVHVENSIVDGSIERTMDGASTLSITLHDPTRMLLQSGTFSAAINATLDRLVFRLAQVQKQGDELTLTFEDRAVAQLRKQTRARKAQRNKMTRAEFALSLVREVKPTIPFVCPQLHRAQPIAGTGDSRKVRKALPYQYRRGTVDGKIEDSWTCLQRLAQEVQWRCFMSRGQLYFASEDDLMKLAPPLIVSETSPGVVAVDFDVDNGKATSEATITARAARWFAAPGTPVQLKDLGPADVGMWLVHVVHRGLYDADATITLKRATHPLPEPAPETRALAVGGKSRRKAGGGGGLAGAAVRAWDAAAAIDAHHYPYVWGGGHPTAGIPNGGGFDCSGSVSAVLAAAELGMRLGGPSMTSGPLMGWGAAGAGQYITVYTNPVHAFMVFHTAKGDVHFGTGRWGKSWDGAGFNGTMHPTSGFAARHWPGT